ncbi:hypothetical protein CWM47_00855 [Spirosoma pollinicola]|uniref:Secretion system C-terminal sorting domain-containing protein n=2 Tax=Spirosoma pollinicola TaxID=2057025 RepID=A0A2K8YS95_9BACT|nr:hypothetical protein CWM47_00855 [Spirosoma pollinicola]
MDNHLPAYHCLFLRFSQLSLLCLFMFAGLPTAAWAIEKTPDQAPAVLTVSVSSATVCAGASTTLTAAGCPANGAVRWSTTQTGATIIVSPVQSTTYTAICEVTGPSAATTTAAGTVQVYKPIVLTPTSLSTSCNGGKDGQVIINALGGTGALQYQFNGQPFQTTNSAFGNLTAGTYTVGVKDALGCTVQSTIDVKQPPALSVSVTPITPKCIGGSDGALFAVASGGVGDYRYILESGLPQVNGTFINLKENTTYTLAVTDKNTCILYKQVPIGAATPFDIKLSMKPTRCVGSADGSVTVSVTGGAGAYQYQIGTGAFQAGTQFTGLAATTYEVTVQDGYGCLGKQTVTVEQPTPLTLSAVSRPVSCSGAASGAITVTPAGGTGAVQYQLTTGQTLQSSAVFTGLSEGDYTVVGTDANGCTGLVSVTVDKAPPLKVQATSIAATCCVCPTGAVKFTTTGGVGTVRQYQVIGQPYQTNSQINGLSPNTYRFRVADEAGCTESLSAIVTNGNAISLSVGTSKNVTCQGGRDGEATVQIAGGTKPFTVYWATERRDTLSALVASQTGLSEGTYTVSVVDSNRCTANALFIPLKSTYPIPSKPTVTQTGSSILLVDPALGIQWYIRTGSDSGKPVPNATGQTIVPFESGQYYVIVTANGCSSPPSDAINFVLTALAEPTALLAVRVVPNPVIDRLRLEIEQAERSAVTVELFDASGRAVMAGQLPAFTGKKQAEWPLTGLAAGNYLLKVNASSRQSTVRVLVE